MLPYKVTSPCKDTCVNGVILGNERGSWIKCTQAYNMLRYNGTGHYVTPRLGVDVNCVPMAHGIEIS